MIKRSYKNDINMLKKKIHVNNQNENVLIIASNLNCICVYLLRPYFCITIHVNQQDLIGTRHYSTSSTYTLNKIHILLNVLWRQRQRFILKIMKVLHPHIIKCIVEAKAKIHIKNNEGFTPINYSKKKN